MTFNDKNRHLKTNENAISRSCHQSKVLKMASNCNYYIDDKKLLLLFSKLRNNLIYIKKLKIII